MIVRYLNIMCVAIFPAKTRPPLIVNADTPLSLPVSSQFFQSIPRRNAQIIDRLCRIYGLKLAPGNVLHMRGDGPNPMPVEYRRGELVGEGANHSNILTYSISSVKQYYRHLAAGAQPPSAADPLQT